MYATIILHGEAVALPVAYSEKYLSGEILEDEARLMSDGSYLELRKTLNGALVLFDYEKSEALN